MPNDENTEPEIAMEEYTRRPEYGVTKRTHPTIPEDYNLQHYPRVYSFPFTKKGSEKF